MSISTLMVMQGSKTKFPAVVQHQITPDQSVPVIDTLSLFRGKLSACAYRAKPSDSADVVFLATTFSKQLPSDSVKKIDGRVIGMAVQRYPELIDVLEQLGISTSKAIKAVSSLDRLSPGSKMFSIGARMSEGEVQKGLFC